jgi:SAM-dependent methyltransferase
MSTLEHKALKLIKGKILDVGAGAGAHSLYLQSNGFNVTALDMSELSCEVMRGRGLKNVICQNIWQLALEKYDTLLFMMNGIGLVKNLKGLENFLIYIKQFLNDGGQIIMDSSDVRYMYEDDEGGYWIDLNAEYYGNLEYILSYKNITSKPFCWLFVDYENLSYIASKYGFNTEKIFEDHHHQYLARLTLNH